MYRKTRQSRVGSRLFVYPDAGLTRRWILGSELYIRIDHLFERTREKQSGIGDRLGGIAGAGGREVSLLGMKLRRDDRPRTIFRPKRLRHGVAPSGTARVREDPVARASGDDVRAAEGAGGNDFEALEQTSGKERIGTHCIRMRLGQCLSRRSAPLAGHVLEEWIARDKLDFGAHRVRIGRPRALDVDRRSEAADWAATRAPKHPVDRPQIFVWRRRVAALGFEQA